MMDPYICGEDMKILYVIHDNKKGGAAISFFEMICEMRKEHEIFVLTPHKDGYVPDELDKMEIPHASAHYFWWMIACPSNVVLRRIKIFLYKFLNIVNYIEANRISRKYQGQGFNVIHSNSSVINFGGLLSKYMKIPHVWHIREYGQEDFGLYRVLSPQKMYAFMDRYSDRVVTISKAVSKKYASLIKEDKLVQIYNGISTDFNYEKRNFPVSKSKVVFLIAGNYCREKGQIDVAMAANHLLMQGITNFEVVMAGNGDFKEVKELIDRDGMQPYINIVGRVNDMQTLRKTVDIEIVASKCETFGRVTVEAMKASNPVIGTNSGGTVELIEDGVNGCLFSYMNFEELSEKMRIFILNPNLIEKMGKNAFVCTKNKFTPAECVYRVEEVYRQVIAIR